MWAASVGPRMRLQRDVGVTLYLLLYPKAVGPGFEPCLGQSAKVGWSAETTLSKPNRRDMPGQRETEGTGPPIDQPGRVTVWPSWPVDGDPPPAVGHPGRKGRPLQGPAAVLSRAVRRGLG